jgi:tetratricopeptide (TPR) repeat protein
LLQFKYVSPEIVTSFLPHEYKEQIFLACALYRERRYAQSRITLNFVAEAERTNWNYRVLDAMLLVRERNYTNAIGKIINLFHDPMASNFDTRALLAALLAQSYLHANMMHEFDTFCGQEYANIDKSNNYGYFMDIISSHLPPIFKGVNGEEMGKRLRSSAEKKLKSSTFSRTCCQINGLTNDVSHCLATDTIEKKLKDKLETLRLFGESHLHIVKNTLGLFYIMRNKDGDLQKAIDVLKEALVLANGSMREVFISTNLALAYALKGEVVDFQEAHKLINNVRSIAENNAEVDRIRQKYFVNCALIEQLCRIKGKQQGLYSVEEYLVLAEGCEDRRDSGITINAITCIRNLDRDNHNNYNKIRNCIVPCYLEYWYFDPLKLVDIAGIA